MNYSYLGNFKGIDQEKNNNKTTNLHFPCKPKCSRLGCETTIWRKVENGAHGLFL